MRVRIPSKLLLLGLSVLQSLFFLSTAFVVAGQRDHISSSIDEH